jgi:ribosome-associated protein
MGHRQMPKSDDAPPEDAEAFAPSKSARKREASAAQRLGEELIELRDAELAALELPEPLLNAVREARAIKSRGAGARQRQYIGRLMRSVDPTAIRAALTARAAQATLDARRFQRVEQWRARLLEEGAPALAELAGLHPQIDRAEWQRRLAAVAEERARGGSGGAARELFRALRALFGADAEPPEG